MCLTPKGRGWLLWERIGFCSEFRIPTPLVMETYEEVGE